MYLRAPVPLCGVFFFHLPGLAAMAGGIGDIKGGFIEIFIVAIFPSSFKDLVSFVILLIILVLKPTGFFGMAKSTKI